MEICQDHWFEIKDECRYYGFYPAKKEFVEALEMHAIYDGVPSVIRKAVEFTGGCYCCKTAEGRYCCKTITGFRLTSFIAGFGCAILSGLGPDDL